MEPQAISKTTLAEISRRDIDGDTARVDACRTPLRYIGEHAGQHAIRKVDCDVRIGKRGGNLSWWKDVQVLSADPQKRFPAHNSVCAQIDFGLVERNDPILFKRLPRCGEHLGSPF